MESENDGVRGREIYTLGHGLALQIHEMTMHLPNFELFEEGSQIRRSSKSVASLLVEGFRQRKYRDSFLHYLYRALGSADETQEHLDLLFETRSLKDPLLHGTLSEMYDKLQAKLTTFIKGVESNHTKPFGMS